jgi:glycosyltransferase involved in cell wall biosynthesis
MKVLMLSPEPPYPLHGGGAYRIASLLHYFAQFAEVDLILVSDSGLPCSIPPALIHSQQVIPLPRHSKSLFARYFRNARRAAAGIPPLIHRLSGLGKSIESAIAGRNYDLGIIEHFWLAPYVPILQKVCTKTVLDLHNVESVLHQRCAAVSSGLVKIGHNRFSAASRRLEEALLRDFSLVLSTSEEDADIVRGIAPQSRVTVYPNSFPLIEIPSQTEESIVAFSANFEYHPNIDAVQFLLQDIWPEVRHRHSDLKLRLIGRGDEAIRHLLPGDRAESGIETTGPVSDALTEIARAMVILAPLRAGSGTRVKILEAWAAGRPVIATPLAAEGLKANHGENIFIAADGPAFVAAIDLLLSSPADRQRIGSAGRRTFEELYSWNAAWAKLDLDPQLMRNFGLKRYTGNI